MLVIIYTWCVIMHSANATVNGTTTLPSSGLCRHWGSDVIIKTGNVINAVQNEPSIWNSELNSSEEEKELAWTRIAGVLQYSKVSLFLFLRRCHVMSYVQKPKSCLSLVMYISLL